MENKFSIVMPVYNAEKYLQRSLSHVEALPQDEFEILFIDDGSIDQSASILVAYCNAHANARFIKSAHRGVSAARNAGIERAKNSYILFLDADDRFLPRVFSVLKTVIEENGADIIVFGANVINYDSEHTLPDICPRNIVYRGFKPQALFDEVGARPYVWNCAYKAEFLQKNGIRFDEKISLGEDQLFQFTAFPQAAIIQFISDKLYCYNYLRVDSACARYVRKNEQVCLEHFRLIEAISDLHWVDVIQSLCEIKFYKWLIHLIDDEIKSLSLKRYNHIKHERKKLFKLRGGAILKLSLSFKEKIKLLSYKYGFIFIIRKIIVR